MATMPMPGTTFTRIQKSSGPNCPSERRKRSPRREYDRVSRARRYARGRGMRLLHAKRHGRGLRYAGARVNGRAGAYVHGCEDGRAPDRYREYGSAHAYAREGDYADARACDRARRHALGNLLEKLSLAQMTAVGDIAQGARI